MVSDAVETYDLAIVGGGINGAGIARDAAGRGLKVLLVEQDDLASATSSASSKLIHGGLRYLEHYELRLVREALAEREVLLGIAPHIIWPLRFVLPHDSGMRPAWMLRAGLFLYDHLSHRSTLAGSRRIDLGRDPAGAALRTELRIGFTYSDCWVEDSRLVVLNAMDARARGATVRTRCRFVGAERTFGLWRVAIEHAGKREHVIAQALVNAAGPWVREALVATGAKSASHVRLVKGSHIVVPRLYSGDHAFILQNTDRRVVFAIPYEGRFTLIGTTDVAYTGDPRRVTASPEEIDYLCRAASRYFARPPRPGDVVWSYAGVRPLYDDASDDPSAITRDYVLELDAGPEHAPILSVLGGKITTYRRLAEEAMSRLLPYLAVARRSWTGSVPLPGGDLPRRDPAAFHAALRAEHPWLPPQLSQRLARAYGTRAMPLLRGAKSLQDLGQDLGNGLTEREIEMLIAEEWAVTADDILWRRSKLGLHGGAALKERLDDWLRRRALAA